MKSGIGTEIGKYLENKLNKVSITIRIDIWRKKKYNHTRKIVNHKIVFGERYVLLQK